MGTGSFQGKKRPGRDVEHPPHLSLRLKKECSYISTPPPGVHGLLKDELYLLDLYFLMYPVAYLEF